MKASYIVHAKRTPVGSFGGALSQVRVDDLLAMLFKDYAQNSKHDLKEISDTIIGCANQAGEDNRNLARMSLILAGYPVEITGTTINRLCGSSLDAVIDAHARIAAGFGDCFIAGGGESMSRAPYVMSKGQTGFDRSQKMWDTSIGWRFPNPAFLSGEYSRDGKATFSIPALAGRFGETLRQLGETLQNEPRLARAGAGGRVAERPVGGGADGGVAGAGG